ncbi:hypothetical protein [Sphingopyxis macrogoltabida]|uniref:Chloride peroxidase n=1 Tax=Sphingopyxis macrogoltabida TaxID=33050 RepID=A0AAC9AU15_SPHMC|nr:hypothetical protein [Sphingopyxis macrogoltabida]ALJ11531.1 chloride peroxidase [Sphingopyxis macrogoltabida]AMU87722.1 chloride peroxidase [Sphingopyxis macrogoltabida]
MNTSDFENAVTSELLKNCARTGRDGVAIGINLPIGCGTNFIPSGKNTIKALKKELKNIKNARESFFRVTGHYCDLAMTHNLRDAKLAAVVKKIFDAAIGDNSPWESRIV